MGLALECDFRIASQGARLIPAYRRMGLPGDWGVSWFLLYCKRGTNRTQIHTYVTHTHDHKSEIIENQVQLY